MIKGAVTNATAPLKNILIFFHLITQLIKCKTIYLLYVLHK